MKIFLSYAREDRDIAERVFHSLRARHRVFYDRKGLNPTENHNLRIRREINSSQLFIFLMSSHSIQETTYAMTELNFAMTKWADPANRILPVLIERSERMSIPACFSATTILEPIGDAAAQISAWVSDLDRSRKRRFRVFGMALMLVLAVALWFGARMFSVSPATISPQPQPNLNSAQYDPRRSLRPDGQPYRNATQEVQYLLKELGYDIGAPDGYEGPKTTSVIEEFQRKHNLPVSGAADTTTLEVIRARAQKVFLQKIEAPLDISGYVVQSYLSEEADGIAKVVPEKLYVRDTAGGEVVGILGAGAAVRIVESQGEWARIETVEKGDSGQR